MRFLTRLHALAAVTVISILYFSLVRPSLHIQTRIQKVWQGSPRRLVVFGDDWSDTCTYRVSPPPKSTIRHRDPDQGELWTEALCEELLCDDIDNFARSKPQNVEYDTIGSVVDSDIFANATAGTRKQTLALFDFKAQVQQFIQYEQQRPLIPGRRRGSEWSVFTVFFGIWDLMEYSTLEKEAAIQAIDRSIEELLHNLDTLAEHVGGPIKVVVPKLVDVTFLPRFQSKFPSGKLAQRQHQSVFLWTYWNTALSQAAAEWGHGDLYVPDLNEVVMNQVREKQMYSKQVSDAKGSGKQVPLFDEVVDPCVPLKPDGNEPQTAGTDKCSDPAQHLFWDDMHLSGPAHRLIGREAGRLVRQNSTVNSDARERASLNSATDQKNNNQGASEPGQRTRGSGSRFWLRFARDGCIPAGSSNPRAYMVIISAVVLSPPCINSPRLPHLSGTIILLDRVRQCDQSAMGVRGVTDNKDKEAVDLRRTVARTKLTCSWYNEFAPQRSQLSQQQAASSKNVCKSSAAAADSSVSSPSPGCDVLQHSKEVLQSKQLPSPEASSPKLSRKRAASPAHEANGLARSQSNSPTDFRDVQNSHIPGTGELSGHVCLCQPEPKIPRPRNAFILYRQHHQSSIVARNPGLANPDISKIIGEQWKAEPDEQKKVWQDLAVEEKARHQEQYPDYRYQPRRVGKTGSISAQGVQHTTVDKYRCPRCGGRSIKTPTSPFLSSATPTPTLPPLRIDENATPTTRYLPMMSGLSLESPAAYRRRPGPSNLNHSAMAANPNDATMYSPLTPDGKRRRYNYPPASGNGRSMSYYSHGRRDSLPQITPIRPSPPNSATMPPPPRTPRRGSVDLNVLVPPNHDQSRSVEAMVMSVPYPVKIKVLGRITPPLKAPGPTSPAIQVRGAIIAVEGEDTAGVKDLADWLHDFLSKDEDYSPKLGIPPKGPENEKGDVTFEDYLDLVREWHSKSKEMVEYITTPIKSTSSETASSSSSSSNFTSTSTATGKDKDKDKDKSTSSPPSNPATSSQVKPIVILPTYQLRASDLYSSRIPILDAYSPTDHWQWMATLWRGTVGPDLTIYIHSYDPKEGLGTAKLVELSEEVRCLTVRKEKGGQFESAALRRVGFEVSEWIQGIGRVGGGSGGEGR
ncbi:hypothetical protein BDV96DRAFT_598743 [Lophiotrema nucula]|uniref:HMG box domain-containing protein n=1 Tax=Lophiotrema nucula TaxID=690887 RepID=A0A6A5ZBR7_9PLEO|nr:hypothetical protein BDV96DRAFT_598743 [Lophiotrema nucula]